MRALVVLLAGAGALAGAVVGAIAHQAASQPTGWTLYAPALPRRYADYLPVGHTSWFPGVIGYVAVGLAGGLVAAAVLLALRFRLVRAPRAA